MGALDAEVALETKLQQLTNPPSIAWEDVPYTPTTSTLYLRVQHLHNQARGLWQEGGKGVLVGILQVLVVAPANRGKVTAKQEADKIAALFEPVQHLSANGSTVVITKPPTVSGGVADGDGWYVVPVSIPWEMLPSAA